MGKAALRIGRPVGRAATRPLTVGPDPGLMACDNCQSSGRDDVALLGLEDLVALNREIAGLTRAGVPLGRGLLGLGHDVPGRLGRIARELAGHIERGESLPDALRRAGPEIPSSYRAVVEAGLRSGRLPAALEDLASYARGFAELRRAIGRAFLYPLIVLLMAYGLFVLGLVVLIPRMRGAFAALGVPDSTLLAQMEALGGSAPSWAPILPVVIALGVLGWMRLGRARGLDAGRSFAWVPWVGSILAYQRAANFAGWLALLIEHGVPIPEALELTGAASGDPALRAASLRMAEAARRGSNLADLAREEDVRLPPLLRWLIAGGMNLGDPARALRHASEAYRRRALFQADVVRTLGPAVLLLTIGGTSAALYALALFAPWTSMLRALARVG
jgi:type II secretory pathway component PulF